MVALKQRLPQFAYFLVARPELEQVIHSCKKTVVSLLSQCCLDRREQRRNAAMSPFGLLQKELNIGCTDRRINLFESGNRSAVVLHFIVLARL